MAPDPRFTKAYNAMRNLGIPVDEVKPILKKLLTVYDRRWEIIEEGNYRTLVEAYFAFKEDKQAEGESNGEKATQELILIEDDDPVSSTENSVQVSYVEDTEIPTEISIEENIKPSQPSTGNMIPTATSQALQTRLSEVPCMDARDRKWYPEKSESEDWIGQSSSPHMQRTNMPVDHYRQELMTPKSKKLKLHLGPVSSRFRGPWDSSNENQRFRSVDDFYPDTKKKDDNPAFNSNTRICKGNIDIASSPEGEVKISLNCQEEDLCQNYMKMGMNSNRKGSNGRHANSLNMACMPQAAVAHCENNSVHSLTDIAKGSENVKISLLDETGNEDLPEFNYIPNNIIYQSANVNISLARIADEGCCSDCSGDCLSLSFPCACAQETGGEFAYTPQGLLKEEFLTVCMSMKIEPQDNHFVYCQECPLERSKKCKGHLVRKFIKECWRKCGCDMQCGNRVVQRGLRCKLQVFLTREGKGWGLRTLEDLPKGCFVCEYVGEILTNTELYDRILQKSGKDRHTYPVTLDADWGSEGVLKDEEALCLDATYNGNVARFINHRCSDANLIDIPVEVETPDRHYYHIALFTNREVKAYEELTWDYGIEFDDLDHPIKAFHCCCGSSFCRDRKQKGTRLSRRKKHR